MAKTFNILATIVGSGLFAALVTLFFLENGFLMLSQHRAPEGAFIVPHHTKGVVIYLTRSEATADTIAWTAFYVAAAATVVAQVCREVTANKGRQ